MAIVRTLWGDVELDEWKAEWQDMPEFTQEDTNAFQSIIVHFESEEGKNEFARLINQQITNLTKSIWYPKYNRDAPSKYIYSTNNYES